MPGPDTGDLSIVKVGGSLFDLPTLGPRLRRLLHRFAGGRVLLVPGGGTAADVVRDWDRVHQLGEEASHWLALQAVRLNAHFIARLLPGTHVVSHPNDMKGTSAILDAFAFATSDEQSANPLPHRWDVTTDAIAARAAVVGSASELVLLKSADPPPGMEWRAAARAGLVDPVFADVIAESGFKVVWVNFRSGEEYPL